MKDTSLVASFFLQANPKNVKTRKNETVSSVPKIDFAFFFFFFFFLGFPLFVDFPLFPCGHNYLVGRGIILFI